MYDFFSHETLLERLCHAVLNKNKKIVFLVGAPVSSPLNNGLGVANVDGIVELIRENFKPNKETLELLDKQLVNASGNAYQVAINFLLGHRGQDSVNDLIRTAVIKSRFDHHEILSEIKNYTNLDQLATSLEAEKEKWHIPDCLNSLALLVKNFPNNFSLQLTTNFDPLLSLALQRNDIFSYRSVLSKDGSLNQTQADGCHVVHLHGYWRGNVDTLHTPKQLTQTRPKLKSSLSDLLRNNLIVPIAYSGWDDIFMKSLLDVIADEDSKLEVLWTYYGNNDIDLVSQNKKQLQSFEAGLSSGRLVLYKDVDCHLFFNELLEKLIKQKNPTLDSESNGIIIDKSTLIEIEALLNDSNNINYLEPKETEKVSTDTIPQINDLFGRDIELSKVRDILHSKIISINGIGGQGKSSIAAFYALECKNNKDFMFIDWRDCREYDNTFQSILIKSVHYISLKSGKQITLDILRELSIENLCQAFVKITENTIGLIVFDNIDQYIDLETGDPIKELKFLLDILQRRTLKSQIIFTSRPQLNIYSDLSQVIALGGLNLSASKQLFEKKAEQSISELDLNHLCIFTNGHPLWISLIASKCRHDKKDISKLINELSTTKGTLPEKTISPMWEGLNEKQKIVLRTLAELERPLSKEDFSEIDFELNYNQISKALRVLKDLSLVEVRHEIEGKEVIDLHPLIRQYIRKNFPRAERQKFISRIILIVDNPNRA